MTDIASWADFSGISTDLSGDYVLTTNLSSSDAGWAGIGSPYTPFGFISGVSYTTFTGTFNGSYFTISDIHCVKIVDSYIGMFANLSGSAEVKNVGVVNSTFNGYGDAGTIAGRNAGLIENVYCDTNSSAESVTAGGIVSTNTGSILNSYKAGTTASAFDAGGIVYSNSGIIENCYNVGKVYAMSDAAGFANANTGSIINCGWYTGAGGEALYAIAIGSLSVTHETGSLIDFYNREYDYVSETQDGMYRDSNGSYLWDSPPWYWQTAALPLFTEEILSIKKTMLSPNTKYW